MANYFFDTMTQAQADTYQQATDFIVFRGGSASTASVLFNPFTLTSPASITLTIDGKSLSFADDAATIRGQNLSIFPDGSKLLESGPAEVAEKVGLRTRAQTSF